MPAYRWRSGRRSQPPLRRPPIRPSTPNAPTRAPTAPAAANGRHRTAAAPAGTATTPARETGSRASRRITRRVNRRVGHGGPPRTPQTAGRTTDEHATPNPTSPVRGFPHGGHVPRRTFRAQRASLPGPPDQPGPGHRGLARPPRRAHHRPDHRRVLHQHLHRPAPAGQAARHRPARPVPPTPTHRWVQPLALGHRPTRRATGRRRPRRRNTHPTRPTRPPRQAGRQPDAAAPAGHQPVLRRPARPRPRPPTDPPPALVVRTRHRRPLPRAHPPRRARPVA